LDAFFHDVSTHEDDLYAWFLKNVAWNEALGQYQLQVLDWHDISDAWHHYAALWHIDYYEFLRMLEDFADALHIHHYSLEGSLDPVFSNLTDWHETLQLYEYMLATQHALFQSYTDDHNEQVERTYEFFQALVSWFDELHEHHEFLDDWRDGLVELNDDLLEVYGYLDDALNIFHTGLYELPEVPEELPHYDFPAIYLPSLAHAITTGPSLVAIVSPPTFIDPQIVISEIDIVVTPPSVQEISEIVLNLASPFPNIPRFCRIENLMPTMPPQPPPPPPPDCPPCLSCPPDYYPPYYYPPDFPPLYPPSYEPQTFGPWHMPIPMSSDDCEWVKFMEKLEDFIDNLNNFFIPMLEEDAETIYKFVSSLEWYATQINLDALALYGQVNQINDYYIYNLNNYAGQLGNFMTYLNDEIEYLSDWYSDLTDDFDAIYNWRRDLGESYAEITEFRDLVDDSAGAMEYIHYHLLNFERDLYLLYRPEMPDIFDFVEHIPDLADELAPGEPDNLPTLNHPTWDPEIEAPAEYDGAELYGIFDIAFPIATESIASVMELPAPPLFLEYAAPTEVHDHRMLFAYRPTSPLIPPPPRPDGFWASLDLMHDQLLSFDVDEFLTDDIIRQIERSLVNYEEFLDSIRYELSYLFEDNIWQMHDVNAEYNRFLQGLRSAALAAASYEQELLQEAIDTFVALREITNENTLDRLGGFATMMPESRAVAGVNQQLVNFAVMPFDFTPSMVRDQLVFEHPESMVDVFGRMQRIGIWVAVGVLVVTLASLPVTYFYTKRKRERMNG